MTDDYNDFYDSAPTYPDGYSKAPVLAQPGNPNMTAMIQMLLNGGLGGIAQMMPQLSMPQIVNAQGAAPQAKNIGTTSSTNFYQDIMDITSDPLSAGIGSGANAFDPQAFAPTVNQVAVATPGLQRLQMAARNGGSLEGLVAQLMLGPNGNGIGGDSPGQIRYALQQLLNKYQEDPTLLSDEELQFVQQIPPGEPNTLGEVEPNVDYAFDLAQQFSEGLAIDPVEGPGETPGSMRQWVDDGTGNQVLMEISETPSASAQAFIDAGLSLPTDQFNTDMLMGDQWQQQEDAYRNWYADQRNQVQGTGAEVRGDMAAAAMLGNQQAQDALPEPAAARGDENGGTPMVQPVASSQPGAPDADFTAALGMTSPSQLASWLSDNGSSLTPQQSSQLNRYIDEQSQLNAGNSTLMDWYGVDDQLEGLDIAQPPDAASVEDYGNLRNLMLYSMVSPDKGPTDWYDFYDQNPGASPEEVMQWALHNWSSVPADQRENMPEIIASTMIPGHGPDEQRAYEMVTSWLNDATGAQDVMEWNSDDASGSAGQTFPGYGALRQQQLAAQQDEPPPYPWTEPPPDPSVPQTAGANSDVVRRNGGPLAPQMSSQMQQMLASILPQNGQQSTTPAVPFDLEEPGYGVTPQRTPPDNNIPQLPRIPDSRLSQILPGNGQQSTSYPDSPLSGGAGPGTPWHGVSGAVSGNVTRQADERQRLQEAMLQMLLPRNGQQSTTPPPEPARGNENGGSGQPAPNIYQNPSSLAQAYMARWLLDSGRGNENGGSGQTALQQSGRGQESAAEMAAARRPARGDENGGSGLTALQQSGRGQESAAEMTGPQRGVLKGSPINMPLIGRRIGEQREFLSRAVPLQRQRRSDLRRANSRQLENVYNGSYGRALAQSYALHLMGIRPLDMELQSRNQALSAAGIRSA